VNRHFRLIGLLGVLCSSGYAQTSGGALYLESGLGRRSGDFGSPTTSTLSFAYGTVGYASSRYDVSATLPMLQLKTTGNGTSEQSSGSGDVLLRGIRRFVGNGISGFYLDGGLALKLPTANDSKGLGTGKMDIGVFLTPHYRWDRLQVSGLAGWIKTGGFGGMGSGMGSGMGGGSTVTQSDDGMNGGAYVVGSALSLFHYRTKYSLSFEARGPQFQGSPGAREITADVFHLFNPKWAMKASAFVGLSNGGPKNGLGLAIVYWP